MFRSIWAPVPAGSGSFRTTGRIGAERRHAWVGFTPIGRDAVTPPPTAEHPCSRNRTPPPGSPAPSRATRGENFGLVREEKLDAVTLEEVAGVVAFVGRDRTASASQVRGGGGVVAGLLSYGPRSRPRLAAAHRLERLTPLPQRERLSARGAVSSGSLKDVLGIAASLGGLAGLAAYGLALVWHLAAKKKQNSIATTLAGEPLLDGKQITQIIRDTSDTDARVKMLSLALKSQEKATKLLAALEKHHGDILKTFSAQQAGSQRSFVVALGLTLITALLVVAYYSPDVVKVTDSILILPSKDTIALISISEPCSAELPTFRVKIQGNFYPLSRCGLVLGAKEPTAAQIRQREKLYGVSNDEWPTVVERSMPLQPQATMELQRYERDEYRPCKSATMDTVTFSGESVWLIDAVKFCL